MDNDDDIWNSNDIDSIDRKINQSANDDLDGVQSALNNVELFAPEDMVTKAKEMIEDCTKAELKKVLQLLINLSRKSFQEE